ncbi:MAG: DUF4833 domain-containing protein [Hyphomicrobiaceae bacterium]|nr:DUF4833 domain-containing protein [Hyphomicrobiaceae bacterium]
MAVCREIALAGLVALAFGAPSEVLAQAAEPSFCSDDPRYPTPDDKDLVFYLQRSLDPNTVVYAVNRRADGSVDTADPVQVYWRRYQEGGGRKELDFLQRNLAFGVNLAPSKDSPGDYVATLNAYPNIPVLIDETDDGGYRALMRISGRPAQLVCVYVEMRQIAGFLPQVIHIDFYGRTLDGGDKIAERRPP